MANFCTSFQVPLSTFTPMSPNHKDTTSKLVVAQHTRDDSGKVSSITFGVNGSAQRFPKALVIGVRKAGTHALITYLSLHPDIAATTREVHYFDGNYDHGTEWYRHQMAYSQPYQLTMESSPKYFHDPKVPSRIREFNSSMALVLVVRDPVLRAVSDYTHRVARHFRDEHRSFQRMVLTKSGKVDTKYKPVWVSEYINYFSRYLKFFTRAQLHVVDGDKLVTDPVAELGPLQDFLGLQRKITNDNVYYNETKSFFCMRYLNGTSYCLPSDKGRPHPDVKPAILDKLKQYFYPFNQKFYEAVGKTFPWD